MNTNRILIGLIVVLIALSFPAQAQDDGWSSALEVPGAQTLADGSAEFTECFIAWSHCGPGGPWYKCEDTNGYYPNEGAQPVTWEHLWAQVHEDFDFTVSSPGHLYMIFESHEGVTIHTTKKGKDGEWQGVSVGGLVRSARYHGTRQDESPEPVRYKINPDGSMEFDRYQPGSGPVPIGPDQWLTPGQFRVTLIAGRPYNYNTGICAYVPSSGNVKVLFIPDVLQFTWSTIEPGSNSIIEPDTKLFCDDIEKPLPVGIFGSEVSTFDKYTRMINEGVSPERISQVKYQDYLANEVYRHEVWENTLTYPENYLYSFAAAGGRCNYILGCGIGKGAIWSFALDPLYAYADTRIKALERHKTFDEAHELGISAAKRKLVENIGTVGFSMHFSTNKQIAFNIAKELFDYYIFDPINTGQQASPVIGEVPKIGPANVGTDPFYDNQPLWRPKYED